MPTEVNTFFLLKSEKITNLSEWPLELAESWLFKQLWKAGEVLHVLNSSSLSV